MNWLAMLVRNILCCYQALVLLGRDSLCCLWEARSSLLFWSREVTGEGSWQPDGDKSLVCEPVDPLGLTMWLQGWEDWGTCLSGAGHKQEFRATTTHRQHFSSMCRHHAPKMPQAQRVHS